jgi:hypothetical protein
MYLETNLDNILGETEIHIDCIDLKNQLEYQQYTEQVYAIVEDQLAEARIITTRDIIKQIIDLIIEE